ncbi:MAG: RNA polymerase sigma factor [Phycisphaerae bacterium]
MDSEPLSNALSAARAGQADGFAALLDAYGRRLYGYFYRAVGNHHDAEDLLGEMSLRLVRNINSYNEQGRLEHWIFRIAANLVRDRFRRKKVRPKLHSLSGGDDEQASPAAMLPARGPDVDNGLMLDETSAQLQRALEKLDETTREMILLRHFGEMPFKEIAELFDCPIGTALAKVHRGIKALRGQMETCDD